MNTSDSLNKTISAENAEDFLGMMDLALDMSISVLDENLNYLYINSATYEQLGLSPDEIGPGDNLRDIHKLMLANGLLNTEIIEKNALSPEDQEERGPSSRFTKVMELADGRTMQLSRTQLKSGHTVSVSKDISELVEKESLLQSSLYLGKSGYWIYDVKTKTTLLSKTYHDYFSNEDLKKIEKFGINSISIKEDKPIFPQAIAQALKTNDRFKFESHTRNLKGQIRRNQTFGKIIRDVDGKPAKIQAFVKDITDDYEQAQELSRAKDQALAASQAKSSFLANMSHEIRTPMNGILGMAELLANSSINEANKEHVNVIYKSANALLVIINDILDFSKIEAGAMELDVASFDLREMVNDVASLMTVSAAANDLELIVNYDTRLPSQFFGDETRLRQVLTNLLNNAVKFTPDGHVIINIFVNELHDKTSIVTVSVEDTGIGINKEKIETIFDNFTQADNSTTRLYGGTGLGLSISKKLVELMNGRMNVKSEPKKGSEFSFTLPLPIDLNAAQPAYDTKVVSGKRILILDDIDVNCNILSQRLKGWDVEAVAVNDAIDGLTRIKASMTEERQFDLIICDYLMPGMNGLEFARVLHNKQNLPNIPVLMLSSCDQPISSKELKAINIGKFLMKPARESVLFDAIVKILSDTPMTSQDEIISRKKDEAPIDDNAIDNTQSILVAEDFALNQEVIRLMLADSVYVPEFANNGQEAVDKFKASPEKYYAILMDISMPVMDGYQASHLIRNIEVDLGLAQTPIIALTGHALKHDRDKCLASGMSDYVSKPIRQEHILSVLKKWIHESTKSAETNVLLTG